MPPSTDTTVPNRDKLLLLGDFNARVGRDSTEWGEAIGKEGVGNVNSNGLLLLSVSNMNLPLPTPCSDKEIDN